MAFIRFIPILLLMLLPSLGLAEGSILVVHKDNPANRLTLAEVRGIFLGRKVFWENGESIEVLLQKTGETHQDFSQNTLGKSPRQLSMYWKRILFSGEGIPPREIDGDARMLEQIAANSKAIGYVDSGIKDDRVKPVAIIREE